MERATMKEKETLIIGAGMAGIAAARTLHDAGRRVRILEARDRVGGRTYTDYSLGVANDLGASWIHGPTGNPLTPLVRRFEVGTGHTDFDNVFGRSVLAFDAAGNSLDVTEYTTGLRLFHGAYRRLFTSILYEPPSPDIESMADLYAFGLPRGELLSKTAEKGFYYASVVRVQYGDAADLHEISWRLGEQYAKLPGGDLLLPGGGFGRIIEGLSQGLQIETGVVVEQLDYGGGEVRLQTSRGEERCGQVIVTVPLGVLKAGAVEFEPALPAGKREAIRRIGFGNYEKLGLRFPRCFWPRTPHRFNYLPETSPELFTSWLNMAHFTGEPVLIAHHAGSRAVHINRWQDERLVAEAMEVLRILFGPDIPEPEAFVRTGWQRDPFSRGSYSFPRVGGKLEDRSILAEPVGSRLYFAGEATHPHYFATVHGAYESGIRAARQVIAAGV